MKVSFLTTIFLSMSIFILAQTPTFEWAKNMGGNYGFPSSTTMVTDSFGNILTAGYFQGNVDFDPGPAFYYLSSENIAKTFITKTDASGNLIWAKAYGGKHKFYCSLWHK
ncbi:MAG: hypothetical protein IPP34_20275 [Bacteroidetes bacterium]|nr:hypothetical protein [Bacteroidota bacterium]